MGQCKKCIEMRELNVTAGRIHVTMDKKGVT